MIMNTENRISETFKRPSAFLPVVMSLVAFTVVALHVALFGPGKEPDEGAAAHIWQFLMVAQIPVITFFAIKWLRRAPREARVILAFQLAAAIVAVAPVYCLGL